MTSSVIDKYVSAAVDHGLFTRNGDYRSCNKAHDRIVKEIQEIRKLPDQGRALLLDLTKHPDESVKSWAATHLLPLEPEIATRTLEDVSAMSGLVAFSAGMVLKEWRAGRLKVL